MGSGQARRFPEELVEPRDAAVALEGVPADVEVRYRSPVGHVLVQGADLETEAPRRVPLPAYSFPFECTSGCTGWGGCTMTELVFMSTKSSVLGAAATCSEGFVNCFLRVPQAVGLYCSCHAAQASKGNF